MDDSSTLTGTTTLPDDVTTLPDDVTVPYLCLGLDSYQTVIEKYGLNITEDNPWKALEGLPIDPEHLRPLVETIAFLYDKRHLKEADKIRSKSKRQFECQTCQSFVVVFGRNRMAGGPRAPFTLKGGPLPSHRQRTCSETSIVPNRQVLENMKQFSDYVYDAIVTNQRCPDSWNYGGVAIIV
jgi:hypothetical protein